MFSSQRVKIFCFNFRILKTYWLTKNASFIDKKSHWIYDVPSCFCVTIANHFNWVYTESRVNQKSIKLQALSQVSCCHSYQLRVSLVFTKQIFLYANWFCVFNLEGFYINDLFIIIVQRKKVNLIHLNSKILTLNSINF